MTCVGPFWHRHLYLCVCVRACLYVCVCLYACVCLPVSVCLYVGFVCGCQIWAAGAEAEADSGDMVLQGHRSWGPVTDVRVILLNSDHEVNKANWLPLNKSDQWLCLSTKFYYKLVF